MSTDPVEQARGGGPKIEMVETKQSVKKDLEASDLVPLGTKLKMITLEEYRVRRLVRLPTAEVYLDRYVLYFIERGSQSVRRI